MNLPFKPPNDFDRNFYTSIINQFKSTMMKQIRILVALLLLLAGISMESLAQSPTIQRELRLVNPTGTSGYVGLKAAAGTATYTLTLPQNVPSSDYLLQVGTVSGTTVPTKWTSPSELVNSNTWLLGGNSLSASTAYLGTLSATTVNIGTNNTDRLRISSGGDITLFGASTVSNTLNVTGATSLSSTLGVSGNTTLNGLLTANSGATISGNTSITGSTDINTTGQAATYIGNTLANTAVTINSGSTGGLTLGNIQAGTVSTSEILVLGTGNKVNKLTYSALNMGLYRARGVVAVTGATDSGNISVADLASADVIQVTLEGSGADMPIPSFYVGRTVGSSGSFIIYFSAPFTGTFNYAVIKN
jgi:cytoskeletal protein CcmA (bactofilin family)